MLRRRYEILLPLRHNDGRAVTDDKLNQTREELLLRFEAASFSPHSVLGVWLHEGVRYEDPHAKLTVDVDDTPEHQQFFKEWKTTLLERFEQIEIYIVSYPVDIV